MAMPAMKFVEEDTVEDRERLVKIETDVEHIKHDIKRVESKVDRLETKVDRLDDNITSLKVGRVTDKVWWLLIAAAILGVMARGFKWI